MELCNYANNLIMELKKICNYAIIISCHNVSIYYENNPIMQSFQICNYANAPIVQI